jgi:hypothetical protein
VIPSRRVDIEWLSCGQTFGFVRRFGFCSSMSPIGSCCFRSQHRETGSVFSLAPGGGRRDGEDAMVATRREIYEATGLRDLELEAEVWHRRGEANVRPARGGPGCRPGY